MNMILREQRIQNNRIRRRAQLKRRMRTGVLLLLMVIFFLSTFFSLRIRAEGYHDREALSKYYASVQVKSGDTLWQYAREYAHSRYYRSNKEYVEEVMTINSMKNDTIITGQYLILPYYRPIQEAVGN